MNTFRLGALVLSIAVVAACGGRVEETGGNNNGGGGSGGNGSGGSGNSGGEGRGSPGDGGTCSGEVITYCGDDGLIASYCCPASADCAPPESYCDEGNGTCVSGPSCVDEDGGITTTQDASACTASISAADYDQSCMQDSDCAAVYSGPLCAGECLCPGSAVNQNAVTAYQSVIASSAAANGLCACPLSPPPSCVSHVCTVQ